MNTSLAILALAAATLYEQSAVRVLHARFTSHNLSWIVANTASGRIIASEWPDVGRPVPVGSLVKPLVASAIPRDVRRRCNPERCWLPAGHGDVDFAHALAHSCNSYFLAAAAQLDAVQLADALDRFGLPAPRDSTPQTLIGLGPNWRVSPAALITAYRVLLGNDGSVEIRTAMRLAAAEGTAHLLGVDALAKTGTAPCTHSERAAGDGFVIAAWPPARPRYLILVRMHNSTGASAARTAGEVLRALRDGR